MTANDKASIAEEAEAYVAKERFHRTFVIPPSDSHDELTVSYADVGCGAADEGAHGDGTGDASADTPVILFLPGLFSSRYIAVHFDLPATSLGVRVLIVDRPGMGSSTNVPIEKRVSIWVETVRKLLAHLNIPHVTIMSHCAGTVYALNTIYQCRDLLHPERPQAILLAPWVHPSHSRATLMQAGQFVPAKAFGAFNGINRFVALNILPSFASSQALFGGMSQGSSGSTTDQEAKTWRKANAERFAREFGASVEFQDAVANVAMKRMFAEETIGSNSEALHCLKKAPPGSWEKCEDYAQFVSDLAELERSRAADGRSPANKLRVRAFFATSDIIIGKGGQEYSESCWRGSSPGVFDDALDFDSSTIHGTDHDALVVSVDILTRIVEYIREG